MNEYTPPPPTTEERGVTKTALQQALRDEMLEEAAKLYRIIRGRTIGGDVCFAREEADDLLRKLESWAGRV